MKILVTGGTGLIGSRLVKALSDRGDEVVVLTRNPDAPTALPNVHIEAWPSPAALSDLVGQTDAIFNLAGEPIFAKRWTPEQLHIIQDSRMKATHAIFDAIRRTKQPPSVVVNASAVGYYGAHGSDRLTEADPAGTDFLAEVCRAWERATEPHPEATRVVRARLGIVFEHDGGALAQMVKPFRFFGGGPIGNGSQWVSWVHVEDVIELFLFALATPKLKGPVNVTSPEPLTNKQLAKLIGKVLGRPSLLPVPKFALKLALGDVAETLVTGQRVLPDAALKAGFRFKYAECEPALRSLLS